MEGRSTIDLAAGLNRSPKSTGVAAPESDADMDYADGLFPRFRAPNAGESAAFLAMKRMLHQK